MGFIKIRGDKYETKKLINSAIILNFIAYFWKSVARKSVAGFTKVLQASKILLFTLK